MKFSLYANECKCKNKSLIQIIKWREITFLIRKTLVVIHGCEHTHITYNYIKERMCRKYNKHRDVVQRISNKEIFEISLPQSYYFIFQFSLCC